MAGIEDAGIELFLRRIYGNISHVTHLLRAHGCHLCPRLLEKFEDSTSAFVSNIFRGDFHEQALEQSALGLSFGGLGFRKAAMLPAHAHLAMRLSTSPDTDQSTPPGDPVSL